MKCLGVEFWMAIKNKVAVDWGTKTESEKNYNYS